jgi:hypothetical protein
MPQECWESQWIICSILTPCIGKVKGKILLVENAEILYLQGIWVNRPSPFSAFPYGG